MIQLSLLVLALAIVDFVLSLISFMKNTKPARTTTVPNTYIALVENTYMGVGTKQVMHKFILPESYAKAGADAAWYYLNVLDSTGMLRGCYRLDDMGFVDRTVDNVDTSFKPLLHL